MISQRSRRSLDTNSPRLALGALVATCLCALPLAQEGREAQQEQAEEEGLSLEKLFPEKSVFGPSARSMAFSHDGRFAAWLYRPYLERRHGNDLWIFDVEEREVSRITSVSVMAAFQADTREVRDDRIEKAERRKKEKKKGKGKQKGDTDGEDEEHGSQKAPEDDEQGDQDLELGDQVGEEDAEDEKAPRYGGVSALRWSPDADELLFVSGGDVYRFAVGAEGPERLTVTRERESDVQYLPDGSGYTYRRGGALLRVTLDSYIVEQLDPELEGGYSMSAYALSPDGESVVLLARKRAEDDEAARKVNIASYRDRFMKVREVSRQVSEDPMPETWSKVFLYRLPAGLAEDGELVEVFEHRHTGPRDSLQLPDWAPDSSRVAFAVYEQTSGHVRVIEATFPPEEAEAGAEAGEDEKQEDAEKREQGDDQEGEPKRGRQAEQDEDGSAVHPARVVYRFLHDGGPDTPKMIRPRYLADSRRLVFVTELSGYRHLHVLDPLYQQLDQLTRGRGEVYPLPMPKDRGAIYAASTLADPACLDIYRIDPDSGALERLTRRRGRYSDAAVSPDGGHVLANYVRYGKLRELVHVDVDREKQKTLTDSHPQEAREITDAKPEFFTYENRHGHTIHGYLFKPQDWAEGDHRPLLIYVYGGPLGRSKEVEEGSYSSSGYLFGRYMAERHGWVTCTIDPRGMSGYGGVFEKANFEQVGMPQVEDLTDGVKYLIENQGVDPERVAIHGWSFGGFQTQMCMYTEPDVFQVGIAGAGPTEWENYNSWYSTGTIGPSSEGQPDLEQYSLLPLAKNLEGKLLLVHGMEDSNVLYQDTVRVYMELLDAGKETLVELFLDPTGGHGLGGKVKRLGRYKKYEEFLTRNLGAGTPAESAVAAEPAREASL